MGVEACAKGCRLQQPTLPPLCLFLGERFGRESCRVRIRKSWMCDCVNVNTTLTRQPVLKPVLRHCVEMRQNFVKSLQIKSSQVKVSS